MTGVLVPAAVNTSLSFHSQLVRKNNLLLNKFYWFHQQNKQKQTVYRLQKGLFVSHRDQEEQHEVEFYHLLNVFSTRKKT